MTALKKLRVGSYHVSGTSRRVLAAYLDWWDIELHEIHDTTEGFASMANLDLVIVAQEEHNPTVLLEFLRNQDKTAARPLFIGLTLPGRKLNPSEKNLYDVLLARPILHQSLKEALGFAAETLESRKHKPDQASAEPATDTRTVLLIEPNKINQKILTHLCHSLGLQTEVAESIDNLPEKSVDTHYFAALINTTIDPPPEPDVLHELIDHLSLGHKDNLIGIRSKGADQPDEAYGEAGVSKFLTLPASIDQVRQLYFQM